MDGIAIDLGQAQGFTLCLGSLDYTFKGAEELSWKLGSF